MATTDFSGTPDAQMEHIMGLLESNPEFIPNVDERKAFVAEYFRRKKGGAAKPTPSPSGARPDNVESDLDAASSPLTPDPVVKPKPSPRDAYTAAAIEDGWTPEEAEMQANSEAGIQQGAFDPRMYNSPSARAQSRRGAARVHASTAAENRLDAGLAEAMGHNYDPADSSPLYQGGRAPANEDERRQRAAHGFLPGDTTTWEGVEVPVRMVDGRGRPMSTLGDLRRAQEAQDDARWLAGHRAMVESDNERYGWQLPPAMVSPAQADARARLHDAEQAALNTPRAQELRRQRLHARAGIPEEATEDMTEEQRLRMMGRNRQSAQARASRAAVVRRAQAQQNPLEYLGRDDINGWQQMVMADRMLRAGAGQMTPLGVEAVGGQNALNMLRGMNLGQGMDNPLVRAQAAAAEAQVENNAATRQQEMLDWAEDHVSANYASPQSWENWISRTFGSPHDVTEFTVAEQDKAVRDLMARYPHLTLAQAQQIIDSVGSTRTTRPRPAAAE